MDVANGPWLRVSLFVSGCRHKCKGCFNAEAQDFSYGKPYTQKQIDEILTALDNEHIQGFTLLGGEPLDPDNQPEVRNTIRQIKAKFPEKTIWCYSGYTYEIIIKKMVPNLPYTKNIIDNIDVLVDGKFVLELRDLTLAFRGSRNQRVINIPATRKAQENGKDTIVRSDEVDDKEKYQDVW